MNIFSFHDVTFYRDQMEVLKQISFSIKENKKTAIVGANGAGKSTILFHLNGLFVPDKGSIQYNGLEIDKKLRKELTRSVGIVFQDPDDQIISLSVEDDVGFGPSQLGVPVQEVRSRVATYMELLNISHLRERNPSELSYGQKKYVTIAGILAMETDVFVLDEPMAFLDPKGKEKMMEIMDVLQSKGKTVIVTTHDMQFVAEWADEVIVISEGCCLGTFSPAELFINTKVLNRARLNVPPTLQLMQSFWKEEWGQIPMRLDDIKQWFQQHNK